VLDMGAPVKIVDLAAADEFDWAGFDNRIATWKSRFTGLRPRRKNCMRSCSTARNRRYPTGFPPGLLMASPRTPPDPGDRRAGDR